MSDIINIKSEPLSDTEESQETPLKVENVSIKIEPIDYDQAEHPPQNFIEVKIEPLDTEESIKVEEVKQEHKLTTKSVPLEPKLIVPDVLGKLGLLF